MKVLVAVASRHHATREIAEVIADELKTSGLDVDLRDAEAVADIGGYEAVILGSAVLVPLDGSELAASVLPFAADLVRSLEASVVLFHAVVEPVMTYPGTEAIFDATARLCFRCERSGCAGLEDRYSYQLWPRDGRHRVGGGEGERGRDRHEAVAAWFGSAAPPARYDIAPDPPDGSVDISDIGAVAALFGKSCGP